MVLVFAVGLCLLVGFVRHQLRAVQPMIDFSLFKNPVISTSIVMAMVAMIALVGFELLLSQELQFVYGYTPLEAGLFILPFMIAISIGGPFTSVLMNHYGLRPVATVGMLMCAVCFFGLAMTDFGAHYIQAWVWMGVQVSVDFAGMAYELGAGLGVAIFGLLLSLFYSQAIVLPEMLPANMLTEASSSIGEAISLLRHLDPTLMQELKQAASEAFIHSHSKVLTISGVMFLILSIFVWRALPDKVQSVDS